MCKLALQPKWAQCHHIALILSLLRVAFEPLYASSPGQVTRALTNYAILGVEARSILIPFATRRAGVYTPLVLNSAHCGLHWLG